MSLLNYDDLHRIFKKLDKNGNGLVSIDEFKSLLERIGVQPNLDMLKLLLGEKSLDLIDFSFFYEIVLKHNVGEGANDGGKIENDLVKAFQVFDLNKDGFISCDELQSTLSRLGLLEDDHFVGSDCRSMISAYDLNSDGLIDFEEFKNMMI